MMTIPNDLMAATKHLVANGYQARNPPGRSGAGAVEIDREICEQGICGRCGCQGLIYEAWFRRQPRSYVGIVYCPFCGHIEECRFNRRSF